MWRDWPGPLNPTFPAGVFTYHAGPKAKSIRMSTLDDREHAMKVRIPHVIAIGAGVFASMVIYVDAADAGRGGGRGGGARGGGMSSMSRGGGGAASAGAPPRSAAAAPATIGARHRQRLQPALDGDAAQRRHTSQHRHAAERGGGGDGRGRRLRRRLSQSSQRRDGRQDGAGTRPSGGDRGNRGDGNRGDGNRGDGNRGDRPDRGDNTIGGGDRNTNINNNTNINIDNDGWGGWDDRFHPSDRGRGGDRHDGGYHGGGPDALSLLRGGLLRPARGCGGYPYYGYSYYRCDG